MPVWNVFKGTEGNDVLIGGADPAYMYGYGGDDSLTGTAAADILVGGAGNDVLDGLAGTDRADYSGAPSGVVVNLATGTAYGGGGDDRLASIEDVDGSAFDDTLVGDGGRNYLFGDGGNDTLEGGADDDSLNGGDGDDAVSGGDGRDNLDGGAGNDTLFSGDGGGHMLGQAGNDRLTGGTGADDLHGGRGNDTLDGGAGDDRALFTDAPSGVVVSLVTGAANGGSGDDLLISISNVSGSLFDDSITGDSDKNRLVGEYGDDFLDGGAGDDSLDGGFGDDLLLGGADRDYLSGSFGNDTLAGGAGDDIVEGFNGLDTALFSGTCAGYSISSGHSIRATVKDNSGTDGTDSLIWIERLKFADQSVALDTGATQSGGGTALLIGAVLGQAALAAKKPLVGAVIDLFDQGYSLQILSGAVMRLDIWGLLANGGAASASNTQIASYLLTTVNGSAPDSATLAAAVSALDSETGTAQGTFLLHLAESAANQLQVNLVGLAQTGLEYQAL